MIKKFISIAAHCVLITFICSCAGENLEKRKLTDYFTLSKLSLNHVCKDHFIIRYDDVIQFVSANDLDVLWEKKLPSSNFVYCIDENQRIFAFSASEEKSEINIFHSIAMGNGVSTSKSLPTSFYIPYSICM